MSHKISIAAIASIRPLREIENVPWKNMAGCTKELYVFPEGSDFNSFEWRVSIAEVVVSGKFSTFENIDRTIVLLEGDGFEMKLDGTQIHLLNKSFVPFSFAGERLVDVVLQGSWTQDLNLMVRRDQSEGELVIMTSEESVPLPSDTALIYVAKGNASLSEKSMYENLRPRDAVLFHFDHALPELRCEPDAVVIAVCVRRNGHSAGVAIPNKPTAHR